MFKSLKLYLLTTVASLLTIVSISGVDARSAWVLYEPEIPESLRKEL